ncbi:hypothetical protein D0Y65_038799 [Glycine soja]|uniref:UBN2 domain-containing protein n=2 Tax=Glycine subgen. Soja TaxID=1462606 RepID=A0A0R0GCG2_SOYBN|nr:hypothetical protein D0Y65_038799 [Glycine soja]
MEKGYSTNKPPLIKGVKYDYWKECMIAHFEFLLNSEAQNALLCAFFEEEYTKFHSYKSAKKMWDTLALMYEGLSQVKCNKLSLLTRKYELFTMDDGEDIQAMFGRFRTIFNELCHLNKTFDNYNNIDKILRSLSRKWRSQVIALRTVKNLDSMSIEELIGTLKVHEQELKQDEGLKKEKSLALTTQKKNKKILNFQGILIHTYNKKVLISTWEELNNTSSNEEIEEEEEANLCLMYITLNKLHDHLNEERCNLLKEC